MVTCFLTPFENYISKLHKEVSVLAIMEKPVADELSSQNQQKKLDYI